MRARQRRRLAAFKHSRGMRADRHEDLGYPEHIQVHERHPGYRHGGRYPADEHTAHSAGQYGKRRAQARPGYRRFAGAADTDLAGDTGQHADNKDHHGRECDIQAEARRA